MYVLEYMYYLNETLKYYISKNAIVLISLKYVQIKFSANSSEICHTLSERVLIKVRVCTRILIKKYFSYC